MNISALSKTILTVHNSLEAICNRIEQATSKKSFSALCEEFNGNFEKTFNLISSIIERKIRLINLNILCEQSLSQIDPVEAKILCLKHFDRFNYEDICDALDIRLRTYFRKIGNGYENFGKILLQNAPSKTYFSELIKDEIWIQDLYLKFSKNEKRQEDNLSTIVIKISSAVKNESKKEKCI